MRHISTLMTLFGVILLPVIASAQELDAPVRYDDDFLSGDFHRSRRAAVLEQLPENGLAVFFSAPMRNRSNDVDYEYRQSSDFLYLTGSHEPGSALVLAPGGIEVDGMRSTEVLFVPPRDPSQEVWLGRRFGADRAAERLGVSVAVDATRFSALVVPLLTTKSYQVYHLDFPDAMPNESDLTTLLTAFIENVDRVPASDGGTRDGSTLRGVLDELRTIKTDEEMRLLRRAIDITAEAHREVMTKVEAGWAEYEMEALIEFTFMKNGAESPGFPSIVGSGENSVILHYNTNRRRTQSGDVVVIDIGAEVHGYTADVTRTIPVNGTFSAEQRAIYSLVYAAQEAGIEAARSGNGFREPNDRATRVLAEGMAELGLINSPMDQRGLRRFFMHGTSHYLGLDVHDVGTGGPLEPGTVITVEPGLYIPAAEDIDPKWWNIGVRIEDDILVTDGDPIILSASAPRHPDDVEALMRERPIS